MRELSHAESRSEHQRELTHAGFIFTYIERVPNLREVSTKILFYELVQFRLQ